ncbi:MAG: ABC transporter permease, partial [Succiniclasticum sp.]|nr:ABC transporter permease [Succiniclasticum sp.]
MGKYIVKRVLFALLTIIIVSLITFFVMNMVPGGPFNKEKAVSQAVLDELNARYNLDKPVGVQYVLYMKNILH